MGGEEPEMSIRLWSRFRAAPAPQSGPDNVVLLIWLVALIAIAVVFVMGMR